MEQLFCANCGKTNWSRYFETCECLKPDFRFKEFREYEDYLRTKREEGMKMFKRVYVVCDGRPGKPEDEIWTLSEDPNQTGWETDSGCSGYGLTKAKAEFYAKCINEKLREAAE